MKGINVEQVSSHAFLFVWTIDCVLPNVFLIHVIRNYINPRVLLNSSHPHVLLPNIYKCPTLKSKSEYSAGILTFTKIIINFLFYCRSAKSVSDNQNIPLTILFTNGRNK